MPTVFRWRGYRFFWYQADGGEPPHVHIWKDGRECKIWLMDGSVAFNHGYAQQDLRALLAVTAEERQRLLEVWNEQFGN
jgi:hypothetical protein